MGEVAREPRARRPSSGIGAYGLALFLSRVSSVLVLPFVARAVAPAVLGSFATFSSAIFLAYALFADFGLGASAMRLGAESEEPRRSALFKALIAARIVLGSTIALVLLVFADPVARTLTGSAANARWVPLLGASVVLGAAARALSDTLRFHDRHREVAGFMAGLTLLENAVLLALALGGRLDLPGLLAARVLAQLATLGGLAWRARPLLSARFERRLLGPLFAFGAPLAGLHVLLALREIDRLLVARFGGLGDAGLYDLAARFAAPIALGNIALNMVLEPLAYRAHAEPGAHRAMIDFLRIYALVFSALAFCIAMLAPELLSLFAPRYVAGALAVPALVFVDVAEGVRRVAGIPAELAKRTRLWLVAAFVNGVTNVALMPLLLPRLGPAGAAISLVAGAVLGSSTVSLLAQSVHPLRLPVLRANAIVVAGAGLGSFGLVAAAGAPLSLQFRLALVVPFALLSWLLSGLEAATLVGRVRQWAFARPEVGS